MACCAGRATNCGASAPCSATRPRRRGATGSSGRWTSRPSATPVPDVDAELIACSARLWQRLGIGGLRLEINSLGTPESRREYRARLVEYLRSHEAQLDADSQRRLSGNPLRILDSKNPEMQALIAGAPLLTDYLDAGIAPALRAAVRHAHAGSACRTTVNPRLVRGLDYYTRTVFEWITASSGAQNAVCSGGRYDGLIAQLGGEATPAIGFAMGVERLVDAAGRRRRRARSRDPRMSTWS